MKIVSMEEALKRVDELEKEVEGKLASENALRIGFEKEVRDLRKANEDLKKQALQEEQNKRKALDLVQEYKDRLDGYADLGKALSKIRVDGGVTQERVREIVREEAPKLVGSNPTPAEGVQVTESVPNIDFKVSKPWVPLDESTVEGQIAVLVLNDKLPTPFKLGDAAKQRELEYAVHGATNTIQKALDALVGKYKVIERKLSGTQYVYSLRGDAKSRVKETETREAVEAD